MAKFIEDEVEDIFEEDSIVSNVEISEESFGLEEIQTKPIKNINKITIDKEKHQEEIANFIENNKNNKKMSKKEST